MCFVVKIRSKVRAMCFVAICAWAIALKSVVTLKVHLFHEDQKVYKCGDTLVSFGLKVD